MTHEQLRVMQGCPVKPFAARVRKQLIKVGEELLHTDTVLRRIPDYTYVPEVKQRLRDIEEETKLLFAAFDLIAEGADTKKVDITPKGFRPAKPHAKRIRKAIDKILDQMDGRLRYHDRYVYQTANNLEQVTKERERIAGQWAVAAEVFHFLTEEGPAPPQPPKAPTAAEVIALIPHGDIVPNPLIKED